MVSDINNDIKFHVSLTIMGMMLILFETYTELPLDPYVVMITQ
jgi:hypothetical protein